MPRTPEWKFGFVLSKGGRVVMFVRWDVTDRGRPSNDKFVGVRLRRGSGDSTKFHQIGALGFYTTPGWRLEDE
jgi:hypothetical protein